MSECGVLIYEKRNGEYVAECDCGLQFRGKSDIMIERDWFRHAGPVKFPRPPIRQP